MGEYARLNNGTEVKIGTCEDMLYLRFDQRFQVKPIPHSLDPNRELSSIRFRFPWPDEDNMTPGSFADPFRRLPVHVPPPDGVEHGHVQFVAQHQGYNVCLPCPEGPDAESHGLRVNRDGFAGPTFLSQQAIRDGRLVSVMECVCGRKYRLPTLGDAAPVIEYLIERSEREDRPSLLMIAMRMRDGYDLEVAA